MPKRPHLVTLAEAKKIVRLEKQLLLSERKLAKTIRVSHIKTLAKDGLSRSEVGLIRRSFLRRYRKHKFIFAIVTALGAVLVWRGLWNIIDITPFLKNDFISIVTGFALLWLIDRYADR
jgi:hypothetical protein